MNLCSTRRRVGWHQPKTSPVPPRTPFSAQWRKSTMIVSLITVSGLVQPYCTFFLACHTKNKQHTNNMGHHDVVTVAFSLSSFFGASSFDGLSNLKKLAGGAAKCKVRTGRSGPATSRPRLRDLKVRAAFSSGVLTLPCNAAAPKGPALFWFFNQAGAV